MARILSIHAGKTKTYQEQDRSFETAIRKQELVGPVTLTSHGVEGNEVANHKNAVFAYCFENYAYWNETLQPKKPWTHGLLGENLTLEGIDESQVHIGDFFKLGAVTLQVSGCREPCANFLWHMQLPPSFLSTYQASGRTGMYLEVIEAGVIQAGDHVEHVSCDHDSISVPDLARFFMNPQPEAAELDRLARIPGLGLQMLSSMMATRNLLTEKKLVRSNRWTEWKPFVVHKIVQETPDIKSFYLGSADGAPVAGYRAGQFLTVRIPLEDNETVTRCWSLSAYDEHLQGYRISIKREHKGQASSWMHDKVAEGDVLDLMPPNGRFTLQRGTIVQPVVLISGGVGITPMVSMLHAHVARADKRLPTLHFIHATHSEATHAFKDEVEAVVAQHPQFHSHYVYSNAPANPASASRLDKSELTRILSGIGSWFSEKWVALSAESCAYYLCGPAGFMEAMRRALVEMGVPDASIAQESFAGGLGSLDHLQIPPATVHFARSAQTASWRQEDDLSLLELAEQQGLRPNFSCRNGQCGLCRATVLHGVVMYLAQPDIDIAQNDVLLCCALPKGDLVLDL
jgi:ferredoxin-NADP reductase/MOSC domain-containing protein YiiM